MASYVPRKDSRGKTIHRYLVRRKGAPVRVFTHPTKTGARIAARAYETEIDKGRVASRRLTVDDAFDFYERSSEYRKLLTACRAKSRRLRRLKLAASR